MREDVEEGEEGEDVGGVHPESESDRAGEPGGDAAEQPGRQQHYEKDEKEKRKPKLQKYWQAISLQNWLPSKRACKIQRWESIF